MHASDTFIFLPPSLRRFRPLRKSYFGWTEELPLAYDLVDAMQPELIVAIGIRWGATYYSYCQSVVENDVDALAFGMGKWPKWRGKYSADQLFDDFRVHGREYYSGFSYPLRLGDPQGTYPRYDQVVEHFGDESIDLFHIDEDVQGEEAGEQIDRWYPKLRPGGVMVVHDVGQPGTDLRDYWDRLSDSVDTLVFDGPPPLGVLRKSGSRIEDAPLLLRLLFSESQQDREDMRRLYRRAARYTRLEQRIGRGQFGQMTKQEQQQAAARRVAGREQSD